MSDYFCERCGASTDEYIVCADCVAKDAEIARLTALLRNLVTVARACEPAVKNVSAIAAIHGVPYNGPSWVNELEAAERALEE